MSPPAVSIPRNATAASRDSKRSPFLLIAALERAVEQFCGLSAGQFGSAHAFFNSVVASMHAMYTLLDELDASGTERSVLESAVRPAAEIHASSPFVRRLQDWPRGYAGDFETIEYLLTGVNQAAPDTLGWCIEQHALNSALAYQHRNKVDVQARRVMRACLQKPSPRILVLAAGSGADLVQALPWLQRSQARVVVNDTDPAAIELCMTRLEPIRGHVDYMTGNALAMVRNFAIAGPFDLIIAGGLFDYLPSPLIRRLLSRLGRILKKKGNCFFSNIVDDNPYRSMLRYFSNWELLERTAGEVRALAESLGPDVAVELTRDVSGLAWLVDASQGTPTTAPRPDI